MGSFLDKPKTEKLNEKGQDNDLSFGVGAMQGWRIEMEDAHSSLTKLPLSGFENWSFFAVFDGHAGGTVSKIASQELIYSILNADPDLFNELAIFYSNKATSTQQDLTSESSITCSTRSASSLASNDGNNTNVTSLLSSSTETPNQTSTVDTHPTEKPKSDTNKNSSNETVSESSASILKTSEIADEILDISSNKPVSTKPLVNLTDDLENRLKKAIRQGFLNLDDKLRHMPEFEKGEDKSGSTAVACLISPTHVYLINCGDSRALVSSDNQIVLCTYDHKPIIPAERERIHNAGGSVMIQRVNGSLAVSRALGDFDYKCVENRGPCEQLVSPEPEIYSRERSYEKDQFVVLACDGIWDVMSNEDLKDFINSRLKVTNDLVKISNEVLDMCLNKGSRDNMSIIIVTFPGAPKVLQNEIDKDKICNEKIENRIKELIENSNTRIEFSQILQSISQEKWDEFPAGGGFYAKQYLIEEIYNRLAPRHNEDDSINSSNCYFNSPL